MTHLTEITSPEQLSASRLEHFTVVDGGQEALHEMARAGLFEHAHGVWAHPDDALYAAVELRRNAELAVAAGHNFSITDVTLTHGEAGQFRGQVADPARLGPQRVRENQAAFANLLRGLDEAVSLTHVTHDLPDGGLQGYELSIYEYLEASFSAAETNERSIIFTFYPGGDVGDSGNESHPDHLALAEPVIRYAHDYQIPVALFGLPQLGVAREPIDDPGAVEDFARSYFSQFGGNLSYLPHDHWPLLVANEVTLLLPTSES